MMLLEGMDGEFSLRSEVASCAALSYAFALSCVSLPGAADAPTSREVAEARHGNCRSTQHFTTKEGTVGSQWSL